MNEYDGWYTVLLITMIIQLMMLSMMYLMYSMNNLIDWWIDYTPWFNVLIVRCMNRLYDRLYDVDESMSINNYRSYLTLVTSSHDDW